MSSLFSDATITNIKRIKKTFLWSAVIILIGEVIVGAFLILAQSFNETIGKLMGTFALCAVVLFMGVNSFTRMEKGERLVQEFALTSLIANVVWLVLAFLLIWEIVPFVETVGKGYHNVSSISVMAKLMFVATDIAVMCFLISNVWSIAETVKPVKPLKITALACELYCGIYGAITIVGDIYTTDPRWGSLAGLMGFAFIVMACAAVIVSKNGRKKNEKGADVYEKEIDSLEMQAKIQEMVEREVQARMKAQQDLPPVLNSDSASSQAQPDVQPEAQPEDQTRPQPEVSTEEHSSTEVIDRHFE